MVNLTYENQGTSTFLVYQLGENDVIDTMSMGMISNNKILGVLPFLYSQKDNEKLLKYNISSKTSLKQYFAGVVNKKRLLGVFSSLATAIMGAEEYMLEPSMFILDLEYMFVNVTTSEVALVCLPIVNGNQSFTEFGRFFKEIVFSIQFDQTENCDYVAKIISFLNGNTNFSLKDFKGVIDNLIGEAISQNQSQGQSHTKIENSKPVEQQPIKPIAPVAKAPITPVPPIVQQPNIPVIAPKDAIGNNNPYNGNLGQPFVKPPVQQETKPEKKKGWLFGGRKEKNKEKKKEKVKDKNKDKNPQPQGSFSIPGAKPPVFPIPQQQQNIVSTVNKPQPMQQIYSTIPQQNIQQATPQNYQQVPQQNYQQIPQQSIQRNFGETTVLGLNNTGETTVLSQSDNSSASTPFLTRLKNGEKIYINKPVFRIGKEKSYVDYFIGDNTAISRSHADIITRNGEYFVLDNNSTNHTYINNVMVQSVLETKIGHGIRLRLANEEFEFKLY